MDINLLVDKHNRLLMEVNPLQIRENAVAQVAIRLGPPGIQRGRATAADPRSGRSVPAVLSRRAEGAGPAGRRAA